MLLHEVYVLENYVKEGLNLLKRTVHEDLLLVNVLFRKLFVTLEVPFVEQVLDHLQIQKLFPVILSLHLGMIHIILFAQLFEVDF